jgi:glutamyl-Q tRNA(Asp) synthetase
MSLAARRYVGRFAPSPTGLLHAGSLAAALASWLDARAHAGRWLVRIEDVDRPRCIPGAAEQILRQLADCGLQPDAPPLWQSGRDGAYAEALARLRLAGWAYPCGCSRRDVALAQPSTRQRFGELIYPGTCRDGLNGKTPRAMRLRTERGGSAVIVDWFDRRLGPQRQNLATEVGDFVLQRADKLWAYQLAVVVDDAEQGISDVVRGEDLTDNTARQIHLQRLLGLPQPRHLHTPLVLGTDGHKLSKQNQAQALDTQDPLAALTAAAQALDLPAIEASTTPDWLGAATKAWADRWPGAGQAGAMA